MKAILAVIHGNETMHIHADGCISRPALQREAPAYVGPSGQWRITGAVQRNNFGHVVRRYSMAEILDHGEKLAWSFKNGAQRIFMCDLDHGTMREWRSPNHRIAYRIAA